MANLTVSSEILVTLSSETQVRVHGLSWQTVGCWRCPPNNTIQWSKTFQGPQVSFASFHHSAAALTGHRYPEVLGTNGNIASWCEHSVCIHPAEVVLASPLAWQCLKLEKTLYKWICWEPREKNKVKNICKEAMASNYPRSSLLENVFCSPHGNNTIAITENHNHHPCTRAHRENDTVPAKCDLEKPKYLHFSWPEITHMESNVWECFWDLNHPEPQKEIKFKNKENLRILLGHNDHTGVFVTNLGS